MTYVRVILNGTLGKISRVVKQKTIKIGLHGLTVKQAIILSQKLDYEQNFIYLGGKKYL